jgi:hypothetical protein
VKFFKENTIKNFLETREKKIKFEKGKNRGKGGCTGKTSFYPFNFATPERAEFPAP